MVSNFDEHHELKLEGRFRISFRINHQVPLILSDKHTYYLARMIVTVVSKA